MKRRPVGPYIVLTGVGNHPMSRNGWCHEHEFVKYNELGPGPHPCHYCDEMLEWRQGPHGIQVDHVDANGHNNSSDNLVVSCNRCNTMRATTPEERRSESVAQNDQPHDCKLCGKQFPSKMAMRGHRRWCNSNTHASVV